MLKVTLISAGELFGGVERHLVSLASYLANHSVETSIVLFNDNELSSQLRKQGLEPTILAGRGITSPYIIRRLEKFLRKHSTQIVHAHGYKGTVIAALASRLYPVAIVKTEHGRPEPAAGGLASSLKSRIYTMLDRWATRSSVSTVCYVTRDLQTHLQPSYGLLPHRVIYNGIASLSPETYKRPSEYEPGRFNIVIAGRVDVVKGMGYALESFCLPDMPAKAHLYIIGDGPLLDDMKAAADTLGISNRVHFIGFTAEIYKYLAHADALIIPSIHEGLPYILLEAMSFGLPIVASNVGGLAEVLEQGKNAILIPPKDPGAIANALARLSDDPGLSQQIGAAASLYQRSHFDLSTMGAAYMDVYKDTIRG